MGLLENIKAFFDPAYQVKMEQEKRKMGGGSDALMIIICVIIVLVLIWLIMGGAGSGDVEGMCPVCGHNCQCGRVCKCGPKCLCYARNSESVCNACSGAPFVYKN